MFPIAKGPNNEDLNEHQFADWVLRLCAEHHHDGRALEFAILLYDFIDPQIAKVLQDRDYWNCFHKLAGSRLTILTFHSPTVRPAETDGRSLPNFAEPVLEAFAEHLGVTGIAMPSILFFEVRNEHVTHYRLVKLRSTTVEQSAAEIRDRLSAVANKLAPVPAEFADNDLFYLVEEGIDGTVFDRAKAIGKKAIPVVTLMGLFAKLAAIAHG
jgi:hypothetical protein